MKRLSMMLSVGIVCFVFCSSLNSFAGGKKPAAGKKKISLTKAEVDKCMAVLPAFIQEFPKFNPLSGGMGKSGGVNIKAMASGTNLTKLNAFAVKNGYKDFREFAKAFTGVMSGYMYYKTKDVKKMFEAQLKTLPPATAALMKSQMKPMDRSLKKLEKTVTPELLEAVKPYKDTMDKIMGIE